MFDTGFVLILIFLGIVLWGRLKLAAQVQRRQAALSLNKPQPPKPLPQQVKSVPVKAVRQPVPSFEGREGGVMSSNLVKASAQKGFMPIRSSMISGFTDSSEGFDREWKQDSSSVQQQNQLRQEPNKPVMPIFARDNLLQPFIAHEVLSRPKFRQGGWRI
jgi:hypothetical protein